MRNGCSMTTTLLAKDTAHKTAFPVFTPGGGFGMAEMEGGADFLMIADPADVPRAAVGAADRLGAVRHLFPQRQAGAVLDPPSLSRTLQRLAEAGFDYMAGPRGRVSRVQARQRAAQAGGRDLAGRAAARSACSRRATSISPRRGFDQMEPILETVRREVVALGLPLRSVEIELGPSQCEFTFHPQVGLSPADTMMLFRSAVKQICRRQGYHASFMAGRRWRTCCRAAGICTSRCATGAPAPMRSSPTTRNCCRRTGRGIPRRPRLAMRAPRPPSPRRPSTATSAIAATALAPDRVIWGHDNRGVMIRVLGGAGRSGDAAREQSRRAGRQPLSLHGLADRDRSRRHGTQARSRPVGRYAVRGAGAAVAEEPRGGARGVARPMPACAEGFGKNFIDYYLRIKEAEIARYKAEVTEWEQREYFELF